MSIYFRKILSILSITCLFWVGESVAKTTWIPINNGGVTFVIPLIPNGLFAAPTNVQKTSQSGIVTIKWDDVQHASKYLIQGQNNDGTWVDVKVVSGNEAILDLAYKGYQAVRVQACNYNTCQGTGQPSEPVSTSAFCEANSKTYEQEGIVAAASGWNTQSDFNFQPPFCLGCGNIPYNLKISNANSYLLFQWESNNVAGPAPVGPCEEDFVSPLPNSSDIFFRVSYKKDGVSATELLKSNSTYKFIKAAYGSTYQFKVQECRYTYNQSNVGESCEGFSDWSPSLKVLSNIQNLTTPSAPLLNKSSEGLNVSGYINNLADFYEISILNAGTGNEVFKRTSSSVLTFNETVFNSTYNVKVRACTYNVCSNWSQSSTLTIMVQPGAPNITKTNKGLSINWDAIQLADFYEIKITEASENIEIVKKVYGTSFEYSDVTLNKTYKASVRACKTTNCTEWSPEAIFENKKSVIFIHTDLLGSPVAESTGGE